MCERSDLKWVCALPHQLLMTLSYCSVAVAPFLVTPSSDLRRVYLSQVHSFLMCWGGSGLFWLWVCSWSPWVVCFLDYDFCAWIAGYWMVGWGWGKEGEGIKKNTLQSLNDEWIDIFQFIIDTRKVSIFYSPLLIYLLHKVKPQYLHFRWHTEYFLLSWKIPEEMTINPLP